MIGLTRNQLLLVKNVCRRAFWRKTPRGLRPPVVFSAGPAGLVVRVQSDRLALEYRGPAQGIERQVILPATALEELAGRDDSQVVLTQPLQQRAQAQWEDSGLPQCRDFSLADMRRTKPFPARPNNVQKVSGVLLEALQRATECTDEATGRYALDHVQLAGKRGTISATDGRQALVQSGFDFPWDDQRLMRASRLFGAKELGQPEQVGLAPIAGGIYLEIGPWGVWLTGEPQAKFPQIESVIPDPATASHRLIVSDQDAEFLQRVLPRLGRQSEPFKALQLVLGDEIVLHCRGDADSTPTDLVLTGSRKQGSSAHLATDYRYLLRALELGGREVMFHDGFRAVCTHKNLRYVWALCEPSNRAALSGNSLRVCSDAESPPRKRQRRRACA